MVIGNEPKDPTAPDEPIRDPSAPQPPGRIDEPPGPKGPGALPEQFPGKPANPRPRF
jgi:hypothetical protein